MLHEPAAGVAVDVIARAMMTAALLALQMPSIAHAHPAPLVEGRRCLGSELAINNNLPLYATSDDTDVSRIEGIYAPAAHRVVGWLYTTRNGSAFIQIGPKGGADSALSFAGDAELTALFEKREPFAYYPLPRSLEKAIRRRQTLMIISCYGTGK